MSIQRHVVLVSTEPSVSARISAPNEGSASGWKFHCVTSPAGVRVKIDGGQCEVLLVDSSIEREVALELMDKVWQAHPEIIRFICHTNPDDELMMRCVCNCHRLFTQELDPAAIIDAIQRALQVQRWLGKRSIQQMVSRLRTFPTIPTLYFRVLKELESPKASTETLVELIQSDMAISTKIIQIVNSALYARPSKISDLKEALQHLGVNTLKSLVLAIQAVARLDKVKPLYFSADKIWRHGLAVAQLARHIAERESDDPAVADDAYMAGLLHDIGKLVFASNLDEQYHGVVTLARQQQLPVVEVETQIFGATHAEVAAYLVALWNLPERIVEAIALHHAPGRSDTSGFSPLVAVHIANCLIHEENPEKEENRPSVLEADFVERLGLTDRVDAWRSKPKGRGEPPQNPPPEAEKPKEEVRHVETVAPGESANAVTWRWYAWATAAVAAVVFGWWVYGRVFAHARTPRQASAETKLAEVPAPSTAHPAEQPATPEPLTRTAPRSPIPPVSTPAVAANLSAAAPLHRAVEPPASAATPSSTPNPRNKAEAASTASPKRYSLEGIFPRPQKSAAMINGRTVFAGDKIDGATVISISSSEVRILVDNAERVLTMR